MRSGTTPSTWARCLKGGGSSATPPPTALRTRPTPSNWGAGPHQATAATLADFCAQARRYRDV